MEENKEMLELLQKIEKSNRQAARIGAIQCVFAVITAICCIVTFTMIFKILPQVNEVIEQSQTILEDMEQISEDLIELDLEGMVSELDLEGMASELETVVQDVDALVVTGQDSLEQTMEKLDSIDIETLNQAIEDLAEVVKPLADFFGKLS